MTRVLFICLGNICRSPAAEGYFTHLVREAGLIDKIHIDSAGTGDWHVGDPPDPRMIEAALRRGIDLRTLRGRQVNAQDFRNFDYLLAMDENNLRNLNRLAKPEERERIRLFLSFAHNDKRLEVPDPYYGGPQGFEDVLNLVEDASRGLLTHIREKYGL